MTADGDTTGDRGITPGVVLTGGRTGPCLRRCYPALGCGSGRAPRRRGLPPPGTENDAGRRYPGRTACSGPAIPITFDAGCASGGRRPAADPGRVAVLEWLHSHRPSYARHWSRHRLGGTRVLHLVAYQPHPSH